MLIEMIARTIATRVMKKLRMKMGNKRMMRIRIEVCQRCLIMVRKLEEGFAKLIIIAFRPSALEDANVKPRGEG